MFLKLDCEPDRYTFGVKIKFQSCPRSTLWVMRCFCSAPETLFSVPFSRLTASLSLAETIKPAASGKSERVCTLNFAVGSTPIRSAWRSFRVRFYKIFRLLLGVSKVTANNYEKEMGEFQKVERVCSLNFTVGRVNIRLALKWNLRHIRAQLF